MEKTEKNGPDDPFLKFRPKTPEAPKPPAKNKAGIFHALWPYVLSIMGSYAFHLVGRNSAPVRYGNHLMDKLEGWVDGLNPVLSTAIIVIVFTALAFLAFRMAVPDIYRRSQVGTGLTRWIVVPVSIVVAYATFDLVNAKLFPTEFERQQMARHPAWHDIQMKIDFVLLTMAAGACIHVFKKTHSLYYGYAEVLIGAFSNLATINSINSSNWYAPDTILKVGLFTYVMSKGVGTIVDAVSADLEKNAKNPEATVPE